MRDGIHKKTYQIREIKITGLGGSVNSDDFFLGLRMALGGPIALTLMIDDRKLPQVQFHEDMPTCPQTEFSFDGTEVICVTYSFLEKDEIVARQTGTYVWGIPIKEAEID